MSDYKRLFEGFIIILFFFVTLFVYSKVVGPMSLDIKTSSSSKSDGFSVTGTGKSSIKPDSASLSVGVESRGPSSEMVQEQMNGSINKVTDAIKALGIESADIKTSNYNVNPEYDYTSATRKITGYSASTNLQIRVKDIAKANSVLDAATKAGATQVGNINFENSDKSAAENEARQKAVVDAKAKAESAAKIAGFKLGKIINYSENSGYPSIQPMLMKADSAQGNVATEVQPGTNEVSISVTLSFEVE